MHTNQLIRERSPYLLQHAHNPVDWRPWGEEAFTAAKGRDKLIFLSIGYSTCHWCHVMERESFEDPDTAELLNRHFVPIKVDREERPDVDRVYMAYVQATTGAAGWPLSVWLTPELMPVYGGTYFPPADSYGRPGFKSVLARLAHAWATDRAQIFQTGEKAVEVLRRVLAPSTNGGGWFDEGELESGFYAFRRTFDVRHGGFGQAPKFPRPVVLSFLLRYHARSGNPEALDMVLKTLEAMARGGIHDHLGGGFHRYAVDERWHVPHFEKMLYDQAQLTAAYLEAYQLSGRQRYADVARGVLDYVLEGMTHPEGGFYSAEDADSVVDAANPKVSGEGAFYVWTQDEIRQLLGEPAAEWFSRRYGVKAGGNVAADPHGEFTGKNILYEACELQELSAGADAPEDTIREALERARATLLEARGRRPRPGCDDKLLASWNAQMISAFALAARVCGEPRYLEAAERAARFVLTHLSEPGTGTLFRRYRDGEKAVPGFLDDYACFLKALLDLYGSSFEPEWLRLGITFGDQLLARFEDKESGGFYSTAEGDPHMIVRSKDDYDGAEPSGNSVAIGALLQLGRLTGREVYTEAAGRALRAIASRLRAMPESMPLMLAALDSWLSGGRQIVLAGDRHAPETQALLGVIRRRFLPRYTVLLLDSAEIRQLLEECLPAAASMGPVEGRTAAYVCEDFTCRAPLTDPAELDKLLK